jgi:pyruvate formate lyase activating enzyme
LFYPERVEQPALACAACPFGAVTLQQETLQRDTSTCASCTTFACSNSGQRAFELVGSTRQVEDIIEYVQRYRAFIAAPGGITIGGGEPTCQYTALYALLNGLNANGLHIAMETNGTHPDLPALYPNIDLLFIDLKHPDGLNSAGLTPELVNIVLKNIHLRHASGGDMVVRIPLIPGYNGDDATLHRFGVVLSAIGTPTVELLPFHRRGEVKWHALGMPMPAADVQEPTTNTIDHAAAILSEYNISLKNAD